MSGHKVLVDRRAVGAHCAAVAGPRSNERRPGPGNRRFVEAGLWLARNGCRWPALPAEWGNWHTTYTRCQRWPASGGWARVRAAVQQDAALHPLLVDSTTVRAHQQASGARTKTAPKPPGAAVAG